MNIPSKLILVFFTMTLFTVTIFSLFAIDNTIQIIKQENEHALNTRVDEKVNLIRSYFKGKQQSTILLADLPFVGNALENLLPVFEQGIDSSAYIEEDKRIRELFNKLKIHLNINDLYLVAPNGDIIFTITQKNDLASNLKTESYRQTQLAWVFEKTTKLLKTTLSQFEPSTTPRQLPKPENGQTRDTQTYSAFIATPVYKNGKLIGVLAVQLKSNNDFPYSTHFTDAKSTEEVLVGTLEAQRAVIISPLRHNPQATVNLPIPKDLKIARPLQLALQGKNGSGLSLDYNGTEILAAWRFIPELKWGVVVKIDAAEAFAAVKLLQQKLLLLGIGILIITALVTLFFAKKLSKPLLVLSKTCKEILKGNYTQKIAVKASDEISQLGDYLNQMSTQFSGLMDKNRLTNKALTESNNKYRTLFEKSADAMLIIEDDKFIDCNQAAVKMLAYDSKKQLLVTHPSQLSPQMQSDGKNSFEKANEMIAIAYEHGSHRFEWEHKRQNDEVFPVEVLLTAIPFGEKHFLHVVWRDITERKQIEKSLLNLKAIIESAKDFIGYADKDGNVQYINRAGRKFLGFSEDEDLSTKRIMDFHSPEANKRLKETSIPTAFRTGSWEGETEFLTQDGRRIPTSQVLVAHKNLHGEISFLSTIARDITKHKQAQSQFKKSEGRIRLLLDSTAEAIYGLDLKGICTFCNTACLRILGYTNQDELLGKNMHAIIHHTRDDGSHFPAEDCQIHKPFPNDEHLHIDSELLFRNNGDNFPAEYWCYPIIRDGKTIGSVVTFLDITERKQIEKEADKAKQKLLEQQQHQTDLSQQELEKIKEQLIRHTRLSTIGQVAENIADELKHPLGAVRNAAYFMKRQLLSDNSKIAQFKDITGQENDVSDQIINNLLEMTRAKEPIKRTTDLGYIVREGIERSHLNIAIKCQLEFEENLFMIFVDPTQFLKVIENLLSNAQQSIKGKGLITIQGWHTANIDFITVQDSGSGIGNNQVTKVFEPLFTTKAKGTGLGLNISRQIIEQHGGSLEYVEQDGIGAMFEIQLPRDLL